jgi:lincosamide nucleotidyltransferase A/C/D/E
LTASPPRACAWLDGAWGVDALLGEKTWDHEDLDLVVARQDCSAAREATGPARPLSALPFVKP